MPRGQASPEGATRVAKNGYHYTKKSSHPRAQNGWILTHWLTAEKKMGRTLAEDEMVQFVEPKFKRDPYNPDGVRVIQKHKASLRRRRAQIEARIAELQAELSSINQQISRGAASVETFD